MPCVISWRNKRFQSAILGKGGEMEMRNIHHWRFDSNTLNISNDSEKDICYCAMAELPSRSNVGLIGCLQEQFETACVSGNSF